MLPLNHLFAAFAIAERGNIVSHLGKQLTTYLKARFTRPSGNRSSIAQLEQRLAHSEFENARLAQTNQQLRRLVKLAIYNLIWLCLTGLSAISAILLVSTHPSWSLILWVITGLFGFIWCGSLVNVLCLARRSNRSI